MRTAPFAFFFLAALSLTSCTKESLFPDPLAGTVGELGFEWLKAVESCLDSDDHSTAYCGRATFLDGTRVQIDLPTPDEVGFETDEAVFTEMVASKSIRYVYNPTSKSVTLFMAAGTVTLEWNEGLGALEGDVFHQDYLTISTRGTSPTPDF